MGISELLLASLLMVLSSFCRGLPLPKYLVEAIMAAMDTCLGNCLFKKSIRPTEACLVRDLFLPLAGGEIEDFFIDLSESLKPI